MRGRRTAQAVIGAQFGDEGKGRMIDRYAAASRRRQFGHPLQRRGAGRSYGGDAGGRAPRVQPCRQRVVRRRGDLRRGFSSRIRCCFLKELRAWRPKASIQKFMSIREAR